MAAAAAAGDFARLAALHDEWQRRIGAKRNEMMSDTTSSLADLGRRLQDAHARSSDLVKRVDELDLLVDEERKKWAAVLDADLHARQQSPQSAR